MDVRENTSGRDRDVSEQFVELLIVTDGELNVTGDDSGTLVVSGGISSQLEDLGKTLGAKEAAWYPLYCLRVCPRPTPSFLSVGLCWLAVCGGV